MTTARAMSELVSNLLSQPHHRPAVLSLKSLTPDNHDGSLGSRQLTREGVSTLSKLLQSLRAVSQMFIVIGEVHLGSNHADVELVVDPALPQSGVEDGGIKPRVDSYQEGKVCLLNPGDCRVEQVVGSQIRSSCLHRENFLSVEIFTSKSVKEILQSHQRLSINKTSCHGGDLV